jgi:hypothetical protein
VTLILSSLGMSSVPSWTQQAADTSIILLISFTKMNDFFEPKLWWLHVPGMFSFMYKWSRFVCTNVNVCIVLLFFKNMAPENGTWRFIWLLLYGSQSSPCMILVKFWRWMGPRVNLCLFVLNDMMLMSVLYFCFSKTKRFI